MKTLAQRLVGSLWIVAPTAAAIATVRWGFEIVGFWAFYIAAMLTFERAVIRPLWTRISGEDYR